VPRQQGFWTRRDDSFQAQAKRLCVIGHHPIHAPSAWAWVRKRPLSPGDCAFHDSPLHPSISTN
jgi:hypothetical protein